MRLTELVDFKRLQQMQDNLSGMVGLSALIYDPDGEPLTRQSRPSAFCTLAKSAGEAHCTCRAPAPAAFTDGMPLIDYCRYSGAANLFVPFIAGGEYLGCLALYGARRLGTPLSEAALAASAMALDISASLLTGAAEMLASISDEALQSLVGFVQALAEDMLNAPAGIPSQVEHTLALMNKFMASETTAMVASDSETGSVLLANKRYCNFMGTTMQRAAGTDIAALHEVDITSFLTGRTTQSLLGTDGSPAEPVQWNDYSTRHSAWLRCTNQLVCWPGGRLANVLTFHDITDERRTQDELSRLAYYDRQMNLPNGLKLAADLQGVQNSVAAARNFLICLDIKGLRKLNDAHGRRAGDVFLRTVVKWVQHQPFGKTTVYRIEGDEFCIRLEGADSKAAADVAGQIWARFNELWSLSVNGQAVSILSGVSLSVIGLDKLSDDDELLNIIQRTLDISLKENKIVLYDEETDHELKAHVQVQLSLKKSVKQRMKGFAVHFQPIVDPATGLWKGLEALCRWNSPEVGNIQPITFIREAEQLGLIGTIGEWVLEEAVRQCKAWGLDKLDGFFLSVNLSPVQIMSTSLIANTLDILHRHSFPGAKLSLEVTESTRLNFDNHTLAVIENLCNHGIMIALDDFGTGYSSFNNLKNLPVNFVKTDHTFIRGIEQDHYVQYIYNILTELAHKTGMKLVVEGVETQEQLEIMLKNGVDYIQGYYFGRPMPAEELECNLGKFLHAVPPSITLGLQGAGRAGSRSQGHLVTAGTFNVQTQCMRLLLSSPDFSAAVSEVLGIVGKHFGVSRAYLFQQLENECYRNTHEWCATGVAPRKPGFQRTDIGKASPSWLPLLRQEGSIVASDISHLPDDIAGPVDERGIRALAVVAMGENANVTGFIGFEDNAGARVWQTEELVMLQNLAMMIESGLASMPKPPPQQSDLAEALAAMPLEAFVADEQGEILWASPLLQNRVGNVVGQSCFEVMPQCDSRCEGCQAKLLRKEAHGLQRREVHHEGRRLLLFTSLVHWGSKPALLEYSVDITGYTPEPGDALETLKAALQMGDALEAKLKDSTEY